MTSFRRILTGLDESGRSAVVEDSRVSEGSLGNVHLWMTNREGREPGDPDGVPFFPRAGQTVFRIVRLPPPDPAMTHAQREAMIEGFFAGIGDPACKADTSRHPFMHTTPTTDYITVLSGRVSLLLDTGEAIPLEPFDSVVQRRTNHSWIVSGLEPVIFLCVMTGDS